MRAGGNLAKHGLVASDVDDSGAFLGERRLIYAVILSAIEDAILDPARGEGAAHWLYSENLEEKSLLW